MNPMKNAQNIDPECFEKNAEIMREQWRLELEESMEEVEDLIKKEFFTGVWGLLFNRLVASVYSFFLSKDLKHKILNQGELVIEAVREFNGKEFDGNSEEVIEKYFEDYISNDPAWERCKKRHSKSAELRARIKKGFGTMLKNAYDLLYSNGECYDDLLLNAYPTKELAWKPTFALIDETEDNINFTVKNKMVKINILLRDQTIKILRREIAIAREYYEQKLNELYD